MVECVRACVSAVRCFFVCDCQDDGCPGLLCAGGKAMTQLLLSHLLLLHTHTCMTKRALVFCLADQGQKL